MNRLCVLFSLVIVLVFVSACGSDETSETSANQTSTTLATPITQTPSPSISASPTTTIATQTLPKSSDIIAKTVLNKTSLSVGENLSIQSELEYIGDEATFLGVPIILIWDSNINKSVASWYLEQTGNISYQDAFQTYYQIEKGKKYVLSVTWDLKEVNEYPHPRIPPGQYVIQITISKHYSDGRNMLLPTNEGVFTIIIS